MTSEWDSQLNEICIQEYSQCGFPLSTFNPSIGLGHVELVPLLRVDRQATLRPEI
jgi:hypothetical protein